MAFQRGEENFNRVYDKDRDLELIAAGGSAMGYSNLRFCKLSDPHKNMDGLFSIESTRKERKNLSRKERESLSEEIQAVYEHLVSLPVMQKDTNSIQIKGYSREESLTIIAEAIMEKMRWHMRGAQFKGDTPRPYRNENEYHIVTFWPQCKVWLGGETVGFQENNGWTIGR